MSRIVLSSAIAAALILSGLATMHYGLIWGVIAYALGGAFVVLAIGTVRALKYNEDTEIALAVNRDLNLASAVLAGPSSAARAAQDNRRRPAQGLEISPKRKGLVVLGIVISPSRKRRLIAFRNLPETGYAGAEHEVVGARIH